MRQIVSAARVNLATVYYYFSSKEGLMAEVINRRLGPLKQEHQDLLSQFEIQAGGKPLTVEKILEALLLPPLRLAATATDETQAITRLIGRIVTEPNRQTQEFLRRRHDVVRNAFLEAMRRALPNLPLVDLSWRLEFVWGALAFILCNPRKLETITHGVCNPGDTPMVLAQMIRFFAAGFHAQGVGGKAEG